METVIQVLYIYIYIQVSIQSWNIEGIYIPKEQNIKKGKPIPQAVHLIYQHQLLSSPTLTNLAHIAHSDTKIQMEPETKMISISSHMN